MVDFEEYLQPIVTRQAAPSKLQYLVTFINGRCHISDAFGQVWAYHGRSSAFQLWDKDVSILGSSAPLQRLWASCSHTVRNRCVKREPLKPDKTPIYRCHQAAVIWSKSGDALQRGLMRYEY